MAPLEKLKTVYCRLKPSQIEGVGVFAIRDIPKGTDPFMGLTTVGSEKISAETIEILHPAIARYIKDMCVFRDGGYFIPDAGLNALDVSCYLNHSKTPNMETKDGTIFVAARDIKEGEELTIHYDSYNDSEPELFAR